jgi:predicted  nucleic acid-binding Zn-ribbon protein
MSRDKHLTIVEINTWALEMAVKAIDERVQALSAEIADARKQTDPALGKTLRIMNMEQELATLTRAAQSLHESQDEAAWQDYTIPDTANLVAPASPP